jgi:hypothetical protein
LKRGIFVIHLLLRGCDFFRLCHARRDGEASTSGAGRGHGGHQRVQPLSHAHKHRHTHTHMYTVRWGIVGTSECCHTQTHDNARRDGSRGSEPGVTVISPRAASSRWSSASRSSSSKSPSSYVSILTEILKSQCPRMTIKPVEENFLESVPCLICNWARTRATTEM